MLPGASYGIVRVHIRAMHTDKRAAPAAKEKRLARDRLFSRDSACPPRIIEITRAKSRPDVKGYNCCFLDSNEGEIDALLGPRCVLRTARNN